MPKRRIKSYRKGDALSTESFNLDTLTSVRSNGKTRQKGTKQEKKRMTKVVFSQRREGECVFNALLAGVIGLGPHDPRSHKELLGRVRNLTKNRGLKENILYSDSYEPSPRELTRQERDDCIAAIEHICVSNGYMCAAMDPLLILTASAFNVTIIHEFLGNHIEISPIYPIRTVILSSSCSHMDHVRNIDHDVVIIAERAGFGQHCNARRAIRKYQIICERSSFTCNGLTVQSWVYYNPNVVRKPPIVVIHGGPGFTHNYLLPLKLLAEFGYPVVFYDQAGCGDSTFVADPDTDAPWLLTIEYYVKELSALVHHFQLYEYYLYGSSWGTVVAQEFAISISTSTDAMLRGLLGLILDGAFSDGQLYIQTQWRDRISTLPSFTQNLLKKLILERAFDSPLYREIDKVLTSHFTIRCVPHPDCFLDCKKKMNPAVYIGIQGPCEFSLSGVLENWSLTDQLWKIKVPTFVLRGEFDTMSEECSQTIVDNISTAWPQVCIPRAGHLKLIDEPHECVREITRFLNTVEGVRNRYKTSEALIPRQTSHDGPNDGSYSPGKLFRKIRAIMPAEDDVPLLELPNVVILPQAVLPDVVVPTDSTSGGM